jgi:regulator of sirC expression with transglutaminase-like and TPR domain
LDPERQVEVTREVMLLGAGALPDLRAIADKPNAPAAEFARKLIYELVPEEVGLFLQASLRDDSDEVGPEVAASLLARLESPALELKTVTDRLDAMAADAAREASEALGAKLDEDLLRTRGLEALIQLGEFWRRAGFQGNTEDYYDPRNSWLPDVLERRTGLPITLSILFLALCRRLGFTAAGVGLPMHFIVRVEVTTQDAQGFVFLDPFHNARPLDLDDCKKLVESAGQTFEPEQHLRALTTREIISRICNNLLAVYDLRKQHREGERVATVLGYLHPQDPMPRLIRAERRLRRGEHRLARLDVLEAISLSTEGLVAQAAAKLLAQIHFDHPF